MQRVPFSYLNGFTIPLRVFAICGLWFSGVFLLSAQVRNPSQLPFQWRTDTSKRIVALEEFLLAVPRKTYPIIDFPNFVQRKEGEANYYSHEPVIAIERNGQARAYPLSILTLYELTNDTFTGIPILPTFCPLCNSSVVFDRRVKFNGRERILEFEVSGLLRHRDMVMFDRQTESWWQQLTGEAEVGHYSSVSLEIIPSMVLSVAEFFQSYPDGQILDYKILHEAERRYGSNPSFHYDSLGNGPFVNIDDNEVLSSKLPAMEHVVDVHGDHLDKIYPFSEIAKSGVVNDSFDEQHVVIFYHHELGDISNAPNGSMMKRHGTATVFDAELDGILLKFVAAEDQLFQDLQTMSLWDITGHCVAGPMAGQRLWPKPRSNDFAFAYLAFHPEAAIYRAP